MKTRFKKVWCSSCSTMQFAGECGHGRVVEPTHEHRYVANIVERNSLSTMVRRIGRELFLLPIDGSAK